MNIRNKVVLIILSVVFAMSSLFVGISLYEYRKKHQYQVQKHQKTISFLVESQFKQLTQTYVSKQKGFVKINKDIIRAFTEQNRNLLIEKLTPRFNTFKNENPDFYDIILIMPDGRQFLSMADHKRYGGDLSSHSHIKAIKGDSEKLHGFIIYKGKLFFHAVTKVVTNGVLVGFVEFRIKTTLLHDTIRELLDAEYGVAVKNTSLIPGTGEIVSETAVLDKSSSIFDQLPVGFNYSESLQRASIDGGSFIIHAKELFDFKGDHISYYLTSNNITELKSRFQKFFAYIILSTVLVMALCSFVLHTGFGNLLQKLENLNKQLKTKAKDKTKELHEVKKNAISQANAINSLYERFQNMFQKDKSVMILINPYNGMIVDANIAACSYFKKEHSEITKTHLSSLSKVSAAEVGKILQKPERERHKDFASLFTVNRANTEQEIQATIVDIDNLKPLFAICFDVSEKLLMENELKKLNKNLERRVDEESEKRRQREQLLIQQSKMTSSSEILSAIIHQWKQPMTAISCIVQDIADSAERGTTDNEYIIRATDDAIAQLDYMSQTVEDFRKFLMPSKTKEPFSISEAVSSTVKLIGKQLLKENISVNAAFVNSSQGTRNYSLHELLETDLSSETKSGWFMSYGYPNEFKQVLLNLINNARDALSQRSTEGVINILITCHKEHIEVCISDNGKGIDDSIIHLIFDPYFTTKTDKGTGIGLYMAKSIVENHMNGSISAANIETGAAFTISLKRYYSQNKPDL